MRLFAIEKIIFLKLHCYYRWLHVVSDYDALSHIYMNVCIISVIHFLKEPPKNRCFSEEE